MKKENNKTTQEDRWINIHDDNIMRSMGLWRPFEQVLRDENVWTKTKYEQRILKKVRHSCKFDMHFNTTPYKVSRMYSKLIVNVYKNKTFNKTTYSFECFQHQIPEILTKFQVKGKNGYKSVVRKYSWNGKTYEPTDLPFKW